MAETPAEQEAVLALAADQGEAAYTQVHTALKTFVATLGSPSVLGVSNQATTVTQDYWPTSGWRLSPPAQQGMDTERLANMVASIRNGAYDIDNVTLIRNGYLGLDVYRYPFQKGMMHYLHSCTKSVMSTLIGIALDRGDLKSMHQPILEYFPHNAIANVDVRKRAVTVEHLLTMTTGLACRDSYLYNWNDLKDMAQSDNWAHYVADLPMMEPPGERFEYCNGASYLLSVILQQATRMRALDFAKAYLFEPLGITDIQWRSSPQGVNIGWGDMWLTPHDMAKFGWLYLNHGHWEGRQVVSAAWVAASTRGLIRAELFPGYGYQWWSDRVHYWSPGAEQRVDYYFALGYKGQYIFVVSSKQLVAVFTSNLEGDAYLIPQRLLHDDIIPAVISSEPLPAATRQQRRLDTLVRELGHAPDAGYTWGQAAEGTARDGTFVRRIAPAFQFDYPAGSQKSDLELLPHQVMSMTTLEGMPIFASVGDMPAGLTLSDIGPKFYVPFLSGVGSEAQIVSNRPITLRDGKPAYRSDIQWRHPEGGPLTSIFVTAFHQGKEVAVSVHSWKDITVYAPIAESLRFR